MRYNVAIIGQSGVGKSSLVNYLFGEEIRKTGNGEPVTERGFHPASFQLDELPLMIYDSWGLEPDKAKEWMSDLKGTLYTRGVDKSPDEWMHSIFFCIAASKYRVQDFELEIIKRIIEANCPVTVLFTKADNIPDDKIESLKQEITNAFGKKVNTVKVCSVAKPTRRGRIEPFGKAEIKQEISEHFRMAMTKRLPKRCMYKLTEYVSKWEETEKEFLRNNTGLFSRKKPYIQMQEHTQKLINDLNSGLIERIVFQEIESTVRMYQFLFEKLNLDSGLPVPKISKSNLELNMKEYNMKDTFSRILVNIVFPIGIFFTKDVNYEDLCKELKGYTARIQLELKELQPFIRKSIKGILDAAYA
ncbi:GTPase domain-containing protein [Bacillus sp. S13(2024)]|uniref:GTPase n=1 Tax=unclassified Bacillus (in: firmicutes) TaxID=185979 RepID=UPI003D25DEF8